MHVWILARQANFEKYENLRFLEEAKKMGIHAELIAPEMCEIIATGQGKQSILVDGQKIESLPQCLIPRTGSNTSYFAGAVTRHMERLGVFVLNTIDSITLAMDKMATIQTLAAHNIPVPKTLLARFPIDLTLIEQEFSFPIILKKVSGSMGKGIVLCRDLHQLEDTLGLVHSSTAVIMQECIEESLGRDIRVIVIGGRAIGAIQRTAKQGSFKANYSAGGTVEQIQLTPQMEWLAVESARIIGLEIAGVDLLFEKDSFRVCEVNSAPFFEGFEQGTNISVPREIFDFLSVRLEQ
jgi:gamma-F420-2:alpha-L-glutamate ligase